MFGVLVTIIQSVANVGVQLGFANPKRKVNRALTECELGVMQNLLDMAQMKNKTEMNQSKIEQKKGEIAFLLEEKTKLKAELKK